MKLIFFMVSFICIHLITPVKEEKAPSKPKQIMTGVPLIPNILIVETY